LAARRGLGETVVIAGKEVPVTAEAHEAHGRGGERARWRVMYSYVRPHRLALLTGGLLSLLTAATGLALPLVVRALIDDLGHHRSVTELLVLMTGLVVANAALGALGGYVLRRTAESVVLAARRRLVDRLLGLTISGLDRAEPGDLMSRVSADTTLLRDVTTGSIVGVVTGGARVASGAIKVGTLVAFLLYVYYLMSPIQPLVSAATEYQVGAAAVARIQEAERLPVEPSGGPASRRGERGALYAELAATQFLASVDTPSA
jgi:ABC-type multidrug transport system fused ATPase/permease subunit